MKYLLLTISFLFGGLSSLFAAPLVEVSSLAGDPVRGEFIGCDSESVSLRVDGQTVSLPLQQTLKIASVPENAKVAPKSKGFIVLLSDRTRLNVSEIELTGDNFRLQTDFWGELTGPANLVRTVRFSSDDSVKSVKLEKWQRLLERESTKDLLVIQKEDTLDFVDGIVAGIDDKSVLFLLDGEEIAVNREKVFGVIYHRDLPGEVDQQAELILANGDRISASSFKYHEGRFDVSTSSGLEISGAFEQVRLVDFRPGRLVYLSDLEPRTEDYTPFFDVVWKIRKNQNFDGGLLRVGGKAYERGLCVHSRTHLSYRLAGEYRRFQTVLGIDELVGRKGHVQLTVKADDRVLFEGEIRGGADPQRLDYDVSGVRDLEILVDFGEDLDIADHLAFADARLVK